MPEAIEVDPRGLRFAAALTSVVLALALLTNSPWNAALLVLQAIVFALGAFGSLQRAPYGLLFATFLRPRLDAPTHSEDAGPPRFAQLVGLTFLVVALAGVVVGAGALTQVATTLALIAAMLNATTGFCLGCESYLLIRRLTPTTQPHAHSNQPTMEVSP